MAMLIFNPDSPIRRLSGRYGDLIFVFRNGKQYMYGALKPDLPLHPTPEQQRSYRRQTIVNRCVNDLQSQLELSQQAIDARKTITDRVKYLYDKFNPDIESKIKLHRKIITEYSRKHPLTEFGVPVQPFPGL